MCGSWRGTWVFRLLLDGCVRGRVRYGIQAGVGLGDFRLGLMWLTRGSCSLARYFGKVLVFGHQCMSWGLGRWVCWSLWMNDLYIDLCILEEVVDFWETLF